jgi:glutathione S-transferase
MPLWSRFCILLLQLSLVVSFSLNMNAGNAFKSLFGGSKDGSKDDSAAASKKDVDFTKPLLLEPSYSWSDLQATAFGSVKGQALEADRLLREKGEGLPHADNDLRLFGAPEEEVRVTYFKDRASWCPYCQKVWILLEEKKIPYRVEKINMRSYGDKPPAFLKKVPNGLLPAIELDGRLMTDSIPIMMTLEKTFNGPTNKRMWPEDGSPQLERAHALMRLERQLFGDWCNLVFRPSYGSTKSRATFEDTLDVVNQQLAVTEGPFFLEELSIVDLQYVTHVERMLASVPYWAGFVVRGGDGSKRWPHIDAWFDAFECMPSYMATKSDYYTHVSYWLLSSFSPCVMPACLPACLPADMLLFVPCLRLFILSLRF